MGVEIFIERSDSSINESKSRINYSMFVLFLGLIFLGCIVFSGAVSAATQGTSHNTIVLSKNLTISHMLTVNSQAKIHPNSKTKTSNSLNSKNKETLPDPTVIHLGVSTHYDSITLAIANAQNGDIIMLENGATFYEHDLTVDKDLDFKVFDNGHATIDAKSRQSINQSIRVKQSH